MASLLDDDRSLRLVQLARVERFGEVRFDFPVGGDGEGLVFEDFAEVDERMRAAKLSVVSFRHSSLWISSPASFKNSDKSSTDSNSTAVSLSLSKGTKPKNEK